MEGLSEALVKAERFGPDVVLLDLQIPSEPGLANEDTEHGLSTLSRLLDAEPFRPIVVVTAHSRDRELMRRVFQRTHGGQFVFKDSEDLERELLKAVDVALASPAFHMSRTVAEFKELLEQKQDEDVYRKFIHEHWEVFLGPEYREVQSPYPITRGGNIDLLAIRHDGFPDLWELKRPDDPVFKEYNPWLHHSRLENSFLAGLSILTYDDLVERAEHLLTFLQRYRNGDSPEV